MVGKINFSIKPLMFLIPHYDNRNAILILLVSDFFSAPFRDIIDIIRPKYTEMHLPKTLITCTCFIVHKELDKALTFVTYLHFTLITLKCNGVHREILCIRK